MSNTHSLIDSYVEDVRDLVAMTFTIVNLSSISSKWLAWPYNKPLDTLSISLSISLSLTPFYQFRSSFSSRAVKYHCEQRHRGYSCLIIAQEERARKHPSNCYLSLRRESAIFLFLFIATHHCSRWGNPNKRTLDVLPLSFMCVHISNLQLLRCALSLSPSSSLNVAALLSFFVSLATCKQLTLALANCWQITLGHKFTQALSHSSPYHSLEKRRQRHSFSLSLPLPLSVCLEHLKVLRRQR